MKHYVVGAFVLYLVSYLVLSSLGKYEPDALGARGAKAWHWAPRAIAPPNPVSILYFPLYRLDHRFWHTAEWFMRREFGPWP